MPEDPNQPEFWNRHYDAARQPWTGPAPTSGSWFVILNEVKNPLGQRRHSQRNLTGFFATLRMT